MFLSVIYSNFYSLQREWKTMTFSDLPVFKKILVVICSLKTLMSTSLGNSSAEVIRQTKKHWTRKHLSIKNYCKYNIIIYKHKANQSYFITVQIISFSLLGILAQCRLTDNFNQDLFIAFVLLPTPEVLQSDLAAQSNVSSSSQSLNM